jgi:hypothetical protein
MSRFLAPSPARVLASLVVLALGAPGLAAAAEGTEGCTYVIDALPVSIAAHGTWCLAQDLTDSATSGDAISVVVDDVVIDCNGHAIDGRGAGADTGASGIYASNRRNLVVRRCRILGFEFGVDLEGALGGGHVNEDNLVGNNTTIGILVFGDGSVVRRNRVFDSGGSSSNVSSFGIQVRSSIDVLDNTVTNVVSKPGAGGNAFGIYASLGGSGSASLSGNRVRGVLKDGGAQSYGIKADSYASLVLRDNDVVGAGAFGIGLDCASASARARDNTLSGWPTAINNSASGGGNVVRP